MRPPKPEYGPPIAWFKDPAGNILSVLQAGARARGGGRPAPAAGEPAAFGLSAAAAAPAAGDRGRPAGGGRRGRGDHRRPPQHLRARGRAGRVRRPAGGVPRGRLVRLHRHGRDAGERRPERRDGGRHPARRREPPARTDAQGTPPPWGPTVPSVGHRTSVIRPWPPRSAGPCATEAGPAYTHGCACTRPRRTRLAQGRANEAGAQDVERRCHVGRGSQVAGDRPPAVMSAMAWLRRRTFAPVLACLAAPCNRVETLYTEQRKSVRT